MTYNLIKLITYILSVLLCAYGMDCVDFSKLLRRNKVGQFRVLYVCITLAIAYLVANFIISFITINL